MFFSREIRGCCFCLIPSINMPLFLQTQRQFSEGALTTPATLDLNLINPAPTTVPLLLSQLHNVTPPYPKGADTPLPAKDEKSRPPHICTRHFLQGCL